MLEREVHGEVVGGPTGFVCDYCASSIATNKPVCYEAIRVVDMPNLASLLDPPAGWTLDAARCADCARVSLAPATDGYDEVLMRIRVVESGGVPSVDGGSLSVVDYSPTAEGYHPRMLTRSDLQDPQDYGIARWLRLKSMLESPRMTAEARQSFLEPLEYAREIPPSIETFRE